MVQEKGEGISGFCRNQRAEDFGMKRQIFRVLFALVALILVSLVMLVMAVPVYADVTVTPASGGTAISADTTGGAWTSLGPITITEWNNWDISKNQPAKTLVLKAPSGFQFNTGQTPSITGLSADITALSVAVTDNTTITVTLTTPNIQYSVTDTITIGATTAIQVRPSAGTPLASGQIYRPTTGGTAYIAGIITTNNPDGSGGTNFGTLTEVAGAAYTLTISTQPAGTNSVDVALTTQPIVNVKDQYGNNVADGVTVTASLVSGTGALRSTTATTAGGAGNATFSGLGYSKAESFTVKFTANAHDSPTSASIGPLVPGAIDHYSVSSVSSPQVAGTAFSVTIQAQDQYNNNITTGSETINISFGKTDAGATPTSASTTNGVATINNMTMTVAQSGQSITFTGVPSGKTGTSNSFDVNAGSLHHFTFNTIANQTAGVAFSITITAKDQYNNTVTSYTGSNTLSDSSGTISPTSTGAFSSGVWTDNVTITQAQANIQITTTGATKSGVSNPFDNNPANLHHFTFNAITDQTAPIPFSITITAKDEFGNTVTAYTGTNTLTDTTGTISPTVTDNFTAGVWIDNVTITKAQAGVTITTTGGTKEGTSNSFNVTANLPSVTTDNATNVEETTATLNGTLTNDGGEACEVRFQYGKTESYSDNTSWQAGKVTGNSFSENITGLDKGTLYHFRAQAKNTAGTANGQDKTLLTKPDPPTGFTATPGNTQVSLSWTKGGGANRTMIIRKVGGYPANRSDGTQVYFDTGTSYTDTGLTNGTTYYYSAWSEVTADSLQQFSDDKATAQATPTAPPSPGGGGGGGGGTKTSTLTLTVNMLGETTTTTMTSDGVLLESCVAYDPTNTIKLELDKGTKVISYIKSLQYFVPKRIEVSTTPESPPPESATLASLVYNITTGQIKNQECKTCKPAVSVSYYPITFQPGARLVMKYDLNKLPKGVSALAIARYDTEQGWVELQPGYDGVAEAGTITAEINQSISFALLAQMAPSPPSPPPPPTPTPTPATFEVSNLNISPIETIVGQPVTITAQVANSGGTEGSYSLNLNIDGVTEATKEIHLVPSASQKVSFTVSRDRPGVYHVALSGLSDRFSVSLPLIYWILMAALTIAALIGGTGLGYGLARRGKQLPEEKPAKAKLPRIKLPKLKLRGVTKATETEPIALPAISITNFQVMPDRVVQDSDVGIIATITNSSQDTIQHKLELKINGEIKAFHQLTLAPGESQEVTFVTAAGAPGDYRVDINGLTSKFSVMPTAGESQESIPPTAPEAPSEYQAATEGLTDKSSVIPTPEVKPARAKLPAIKWPRIKLPKLTLLKIKPFGKERPKTELPKAGKIPEAEQIVPTTISITDLPKVGKIPEAEQTVPLATITDLQIIPDQVIPGSNVSIIVNATNNSQTTIILQKIELKINGKVEAVQKITFLSPGESRGLTFVITADAPSDYEVDIAGVTGKFSVMPAANMAN